MNIQYEIKLYPDIIEFTYERWKKEKKYFPTVSLRCYEYKVFLCTPKYQVYRYLVLGSIVVTHIFAQIFRSSPLISKIRTEYLGLPHRFIALWFIRASWYISRLHNHYLISVAVRTASFHVDGAAEAGRLVLVAQGAEREARGSLQHDIAGRHHYGLSK